MVLAMAGFTFNDAMVKSLDGELPQTQVMAVRGTLLSLIILLVLWQRGLLSKLQLTLSPIVLFRAAMEMLATYLFLTALPLLSFANISAILQALPLVVTMGAALFFKEAVGWRRWLAIAIGFVGVMIIIRPGSSGFEVASLLVVVSVLFAAARDLATRALPTAIPSLIVTAATAVMVTIFGYGTTYVQGTWVMLSTHSVLVLSVAAAFLVFGYQFIVLAMRIGDVAYVVPYRYTSLLWSVLLGVYFFAEVPDKWTVVGSLIVITMGLFTLYRELQNRKIA